MRVTVRNGSVISNEFQDNIMEDCDVKSVFLAGGIVNNLKNVLDELEMDGVLLTHSMYNWSLDADEQIKPSSECESESEGMALVLYFKYTDEVKERRRIAAQKMEKVVKVMREKFVQDRKIDSNGVCLNILEQPEGTVTIKTMLYSIDSPVMPLFGSKIDSEQAPFITFCLDRESGYDVDDEAINFTSDAGLNLYYAVVTDSFIIY